MNDRKKERSETVDKLNEWLKTLDGWDGEPSSIDIGLLFTDIKEYKHLLTARSIDEFGRD